MCALNRDDPRPLTWRLLPANLNLSRPSRTTPAFDVLPSRGTTPRGVHSLPEWCASAASAARFNASMVVGIPS